MRSIRVFAKTMGDPYYEPTAMVHDYGLNLCMFYQYYHVTAFLVTTQC